MTQERILRNHVGGVATGKTSRVREVLAAAAPFLMLFAGVGAAFIIIGPQASCLPPATSMWLPTYEVSIHREHGGAAFHVLPEHKQVNAAIRWSASEGRFVNESGFLEATLRLARTDASTVDMVVGLSVRESHTRIISSWGWNGGADIRSVLLEAGSEGTAVLYIDFSQTAAQEVFQTNSSGLQFLDQFYVECTGWTLLTEVEIVA